MVGQYKFPNWLVDFSLNMFGSPMKF